MPSLKTQLSGKLDASALVGTFVSSVAGPAGSLTGISDPTPASSIGDINTQLGGIDSGSLGPAVGALAQKATSIVGSLPVAGDIVKPVTDAIATFEAIAGDGSAANLETRVKALLDSLSGVLDGPRDDGVLGALHAAAVALNGAPEGGSIKDLITRFTSTAGVSLPSVPVTDAIGALDGAVRVTGGLMVLDAVTSDVERLTGLMAAKLDPHVLDRDLASLETTLSIDGVALPDAMAAVDPTDGGAVQRVVDAVVVVGATLAHLRDEYAAAMGLGEATLVYLDIDKLAAELSAGRTLISTGDLGPLNRICTSFAGTLAPYLREDVLAGPKQDLNALFSSAEAELTSIANRITAIDVAALATPLADGVKILTAPIDAVTGLLDEVRIAYQGALGSVRDAVAALPIKSIADAIHALIDPIAKVIDAVRQLVVDILAALQTAADTVTTALGAVEGVVDDFQHAVESLFKDVKTFVDSLHLDQALGAVADGIKKLAAALEQARMEPYFTTAANAINTAADVISKVPFGLLPDSMKADVDAAVAPIKDADAGALETEIESLLEITPDGHFAALAEVDAAVATIQQSYDELLADVRAHDPRTALSAVDDKLKELSAQISALQPAVTLQPVHDAIANVQKAIADLDLDAPLAPVRAAFASIIDAVNGFKPSTLLAPVEDRITAARAGVIAVLRLDSIDAALDDVHDRAVALLDQYDADLLEHRLTLAIQDFVSLFDDTPKLQMMGGLGAMVAGLLNGMGLRVYPHSFETVLEWLGGTSASADLNARVVNAAASVAAARATVDALDFQSRVAAVTTRVLAVRAAVPALVARLGDTPQTVTLGATDAMLDAGTVFGFLEANRARFSASLATATGKIGAITQAGFSDADVRVANLAAAISPLNPARSYVRRVLQQVGLSGFELGLAGVLRAFFTIVTPARLIGLVRPVFDALKGRVQALVDAILDPLKNGIASVRAALDAIDLAPLLASLDAIHAAVLSDIEAFSPDALLGSVLASVTALKATLTSADPLAPVLEILNGVRDTIARVLAKLSLETILATPLAIYDEVLKDLSALDVAKLIAPLRAELDDIAHQVDDGLDKTVASFQRLQAALPGGGGGSSASGAVTVG